jgi:RNA polymerase sigma-70 factor (ECF subfamily)
MGVTAGTGGELGDDALMARVQQDDGAAFRTLFERHWPGLTAFCATYTPNRTLAEECAQDAMVRLWENRALYRPQGKFRSYLFKVARNACFAEARRKRAGKRQGELLGEHSSMAAALMGGETTPGGRAARRDEVVRVMAAMDSLSQEHREVLTLRFLEEMSVPEIAEVLGVPGGTVKSRLYYGLSNLRTHLEEQPNGNAVSGA